MSESTSKTSPFVIAASIAVIIASIVGVGAMTGLLPGRSAKTEAPPVASAPAETDKTSGDATTPPQPAMTAQADTADKASKPAPDEKPAAKPKSAAKPTHKAATEKPIAKAVVAEESSRKAQTPVCDNCGVITAIRTVEQAGEGSGLGAIAGGVVGGLLGHQVGGGTGKDIATIAGAVGGGYAGHQIEKKVKTTKHYEIAVRMDDGSHRTMVQETEPAFAIGEKVKIVDGTLVRN
ncbi:signal peptide protein [Sulfuricella sp. T08]|uniref:glycine zipper 2TM domain-containing protein n=1 Tax=Sulfuricella sp. T08 TaxID=1632857 RepID=UPI00061797BA|nr:glycine zipper 2TM domain-containing protein [Sulfuricella sp. T08]GAO35597.1 signal peptide protein [Sulfuricella sp. T08]